MVAIQPVDVASSKAHAVVEASLGGRHLDTRACMASARLPVASTCATTVIWSSSGGHGIVAGGSVEGFGKAVMATDDSSMNVPRQPRDRRTATEGQLDDNQAEK